MQGRAGLGRKDAQAGLGLLAALHVGWDALCGAGSLRIRDYKQVNGVGKCRLVLPEGLVYKNSLVPSSLLGTWGPGDCNSVEMITLSNLGGERCQSLGHQLVAEELPEQSLLPAEVRFLPLLAFLD